MVADLGLLFLIEVVELIPPIHIPEVISELLLLSLLSPAASGELLAEVAKCACFIVLLSHFIVSQHRIGFVDLLELILEALLAVRVVLLGERVESVFDFPFGCFLVDSEYAVVVLLGIESRITVEEGANIAFNKAATCPAE